MRAWATTVVWLAWDTFGSRVTVLVHDRGKMTNMQFINCALRKYIDSPLSQPPLSGCKVSCLCGMSLLFTQPNVVDENRWIRNHERGTHRKARQKMKHVNRVKTIQRSTKHIMTNIFLRSQLFVTMIQTSKVIHILWYISRVWLTIVKEVRITTE